MNEEHTPVIIRNLHSLCADIVGEVNTALNVIWEMKQAPPQLSTTSAFEALERRLRNIKQFMTGER